MPHSGVEEGLYMKVLPIIFYIFFKANRRRRFASKRPSSKPLHLSRLRKKEGPQSAPTKGGADECGG
jgi:hypothetical protein